MFEKISKAAQTLATNASESRRGFLGRCVQVAGALAVGVIPLLLPNAARAHGMVCSAPWPCKCHHRNYGCADPCHGCANEALCVNQCYVFCANYCSGN